MGEPTTDNYHAFFTAANFLSYSGNLLLNRVETDGMRNAVVSPTGSVSTITMTEEGDGYDSTGDLPSITFSAPDESDGINAEGVAVLSGGEVTGVAIANGGNGYTTASVTFSAPDRRNYSDRYCYLPVLFLVLLLPTAAADILPSQLLL